MTTSSNRPVFDRQRARVNKSKDLGLPFEAGMGYKQSAFRVDDLNILKNMTHFHI
jgi:hypothetical protein